jgi:hypothetical protein
MVQDRGDQEDNRYTILMGPNLRIARVMEVVDNQMLLSPLFFQITSVCFSLCTRAESTAVSPLFTVYVTLSGSRWAVRGGGVRVQEVSTLLRGFLPSLRRPDLPPGLLCT